MFKYKVGSTSLGRSVVEKDPGGLMMHGLNISHQCHAVSENANVLLACGVR